MGEFIREFLGVWKNIPGFLGFWGGIFSFIIAVIISVFGLVELLYKISDKLSKSK